MQPKPCPEAYISIRTEVRMMKNTKQNLKNQEQKEHTPHNQQIKQQQQSRQIQPKKKDQASTKSTEQVTYHEQELIETRMTR